MIFPASIPNTISYGHSSIKFVHIYRRRTHLVIKRISGFPFPRFLFYPLIYKRICILVFIKKTGKPYIVVKSCNLPVHFSYIQSQTLCHDFNAIMPMAKTYNLNVRISGYQSCTFKHWICCLKKPSIRTYLFHAMSYL
ncbi:hypothetical protein ES703_103095 [subsurface metagenome]